VLFFFTGLGIIKLVTSNDELLVMNFINVTSNMLL